MNLKYYNPPSDWAVEKDLVVPTYALETFPDGSCILYRKIEESEKSNYSEEEMKTFDGDTYFIALAQKSSIEMAETAIQSYWQAIKQLSKY